MDRKWLLPTIIIIAVAAILYVGGAVDIGGSPIFEHIDTAIGATVLMDTHEAIFSRLRKRHTEKKEDPFTKMYMDFGKVRKQTSE